VSVKNKENDKDEDGIERPYISGSHSLGSMMYLLDGNRAREKLLCDDQRLTSPHIRRGTPSAR